MRQFNRKTAPKVVGGKPQRKNRWGETPNYYNTDQATPVIDRRKPGPGYRHVLLQRDVERFIAILPDWSTLSKGLNAVVLAPGRLTCDGWHRPGIVAVCAWERDIARSHFAWYVYEHRKIFNRIGVKWEEVADDEYLCHFSESSVRAYQLLHILLHELGHHHDRMTTKSKRRASRGEGFAERYALRYADFIWDRYVEEFGVP